MFIPVFFKKSKGMHSLIVFILCFLGLFRGRTVGRDVDLYYRNIARTDFNPQTWNFHTYFESGYNVLIASYNYLFTNPLFFIGLCDVFFVLAYNHYSKVKTKNACLCLFILHMLGYYLQSYNIIRQYFATGIMLLVLSLFDMENLKKKEIMVLCAIILFVGTFFHNTIYILLCLPLYHLIKNRFNKKWIYFGLLLGSFFIFQLDIVRTLLRRLDFFFINAKSNAYYYSALETGESEYSFLRALLDTSFLMYVVFEAKRINIYMFMLVAAQVFVNLFSSLDTLFVRVAVVLYILSIPFLTQIWEYSRKSRLVLMTYFLIIFINVLIKNYGNVQPYVFCF